MRGSIDPERLSAVLGARPAPDLSWIEKLAPAARPAAVAVPLFVEDGGRVCAVLRSSTLRDHPGEVGFPGGKLEPGEGARTAALRELGEEVAVHDAEVLGSLSPMPVITGKYVIHPFVVRLGAGTTPRIVSTEIEEILSIELDPLLDRDVEATPSAFEGVDVLVPCFRLQAARGPVVLYGASAFVLYDLLLAVAAVAGREPPRLVRTADRPWGDRYGTW